MKLENEVLSPKEATDLMIDSLLESIREKRGKDSYDNLIKFCLDVAKRGARVLNFKSFKGMK